MLTDRLFLYGFAAGLVACYALHHFAPAKLIMPLHGASGGGSQ